MFFFFQITLIKCGWNELMIIGAAYRSLSLNEEGILMGQGKVITMEDAHRAGLGDIFERVLIELVGKMEEMKMVRRILTFFFLTHQIDDFFLPFLGKMRIGMFKSYRFIKSRRTRIVQRSIKSR